MQSIDPLASVVTQREPTEQEALLDKMAQLNFQRGFHDLAEKYRGRLAREGQRDAPAGQILIELHRIRERIAHHDYPA